MGKRGKRMLPNGRSRGEARHVRFYAWELNSPAWRSLSPVARALLIEFKLRFNGENNGQIFLGIREAAARLDVDPKTVKKAFDQLQDRGFLLAREKGDFRRKVKHASTWILTEFEFAGQLPTKNFMRWKPAEKEKTRWENFPHTVGEFPTDEEKFPPRNAASVGEIPTDKPQNWHPSVGNSPTHIDIPYRGRSDRT